MRGGTEERLNGKGNGGEEEEESLWVRKKVWEEVKMIWRIALPSTMFRVTSFGTIVVAQSFVGHSGDLPLAAYSLLHNIFVRFLNGLLAGMSSATETLCGQAYGAGQNHAMGIYLQRSWIIDAAITTVFLPFLLLSGPILRHLGLDSDITSTVHSLSPCLSPWLVPFVYSLVFSMTMQMYLQAQMKNTVVGVVSALAFGADVAISWVLVNKMGLGMVGAMLGLNVSGWAIVVAEFVYVSGGWCASTWRGFSSAAFLDLWPMFKLSISSGFMICLELWYFGILVLIAGYTKDAKVAISAFSICQYIYAWEFNICLGFLGAACVRVANELGRGNAEGVKFSIKVVLSISVVTGLIFWTLCLVFRHEIAYVFTNSEEIAAAVTDLSTLLAFSILFNTIQPILSGMQSLVAVVNLGSYYAVGIPLGLVLTYVFDLGVKGLWIGMLGGVAVQTLILSCIIYRTDWDIEVEKTRQRLKRWL
ncbi:PREDICTED: protein DETOXIFICATION 24-like [Tarenaya hassleriana]|uniref:protein DETOXIFICATION 24-like n=1 Tax=Tarenaya hassleriana TaxID=28532 RepID=UPI00053C3CBF|nr:PREDICTED: protein DETOXIFICATION 24-like [Tarenaya hassleriana]